MALSRSPCLRTDTPRILSLDGPGGEERRAATKAESCSFPFLAPFRRRVGSDVRSEERDAPFS